MIGIGNPGDASALYGGLKPGPDEPHGTYYRGRVIVLMYHEVVPVPQDAGALSTAKFERQLQMMKANNFHWITMDQYRGFILHGDPIPDNAVLLTFDDGYASFYQDAYPILRKYGAPATSFLIVSTVSNPHHPGVPKLTWDQVREMKRNGISFYSHSFDSHLYAPTDAGGKYTIAALSGPIYLPDKGRRETEQEYELRVKTDLKQANAILERELGAPNHVLAFPYGAFSKPLLAICEQLGIDVTLTVKDGLDRRSQSNGFRLNAGGMQNDPDLQLALMKHAQQRLGHAHFDRAPERKRQALWTLAAMGIVAVLWTEAAYKLMRAKRARGTFTQKNGLA
ncbi:polysaccharide deacetylase family protein [Paenibacillus sp. GCM10023250]|uniref:polysaccharide deacetylase family protein n=1 Tax=Paenibacillus sp. GCM10023250 TaxID=3252648 RepID=UPI003620B36C